MHQELDKASSIDTQQTETTRGCTGLQPDRLAEVDIAGAGAPATAPVVNLLGPSWVASWREKIRPNSSNTDANSSLEAGNHVIFRREMLSVVSSFLSLQFPISN